MSNAAHATDSLDLLYRDDQIVAVHKPAGLLVHRSALDQNDRRNVVSLLSEQINQYVYPVHRLDKPTSGVLLFALDRSSARVLSLDFENHRVEKSYLAIVRGYSPAEGTINHPVKDKDQPGKPRRSAVTRYRTLATLEINYPVDRYPTSRYSQVELQPATGRRHQLRLHMKHLGHPIIGDTSYGKSTHNRFFADYYQCSRLLLHARRLSFNHPVEDVPCTITANHYDTPFSNVLQDKSWCIR